MRRIGAVLAGAVVALAGPSVSRAQDHGGFHGGGGYHGGFGGGGGYHGGYAGSAARSFAPRSVGYGYGGYRGGYGYRGFGYGYRGYRGYGFGPFFGGFALGLAWDPFWYGYPWYYGWTPGVTVVTDYGPEPGYGDPWSYDYGGPSDGSAPPASAQPPLAQPYASPGTPRAGSGAPRQDCGRWVWDGAGNRYTWQSARCGAPSASAASSGDASAAS